MWHSLSQLRGKLRGKFRERAACSSDAQPRHVILVCSLYPPIISPATNISVFGVMMFCTSRMRLMSLAMVSRTPGSRTQHSPLLAPDPGYPVLGGFEQSVPRTMPSGVRTDVLIKDTMGMLCEILRPTLGLEAQVVLQGSQLDTPKVVSAVGVGLCMARRGPMPTCRPYGDK